jgi:hypothetical protein
VKKKQGRPIEGEESRYNRIQVRVSDAEREAMEAFAVSQNFKTASAWLRKLGLDAMSSTPPKKRKRPSTP